MYERKLAVLEGEIYLIKSYVYLLSSAKYPKYEIEALSTRLWLSEN